MDRRSLGRIRGTRSSKTGATRDRALIRSVPFLSPHPLGRGCLGLPEEVARSFEMAGSFRRLVPRAGTRSAGSRARRLSVICIPSRFNSTRLISGLSRRASKESAPDSPPPGSGIPLGRILPSVEDSGKLSGQFKRSGDLLWNRALRNCTALLAPRES
jgi:hypothetical protein